MTCRDARARFSARLDRRLGAAEGRALDEHLAGCRACGRELARWEAAARALRASGPTPVPPFLAARAFAAATAAERPAPGAWFLRPARKVALGGAIAAAAVWLAALASGATHRSSADAGQDPMEMAVLLWTAEGGR